MMWLISMMQQMFILPSIREGLNVSLMEAMASSLPCLCGKIRGNTDLIEDKDCLFNPISLNEIRWALKRMVALTIEERENKGIYNLNKTMKGIYQQI